MARIFITGYAGGLGRAAAETLLGDGHDVIVHARSGERLANVNALIDRGASAVVGDLAGLDLDWSGQRATGSYSDSKLFVTTLAVAAARLWPHVYSNAVDPGWVPTRMGGRGAPDDLRQAAVHTQRHSSRRSRTTFSAPWRASPARR